MNERRIFSVVRLILRIRLMYGCGDWLPVYISVCIVIASVNGGVLMVCGLDEQEPCKNTELRPYETVYHLRKRDTDNGSRCYPEFQKKENENSNSSHP